MVCPDYDTKIYEVVKSRNLLTMPCCGSECCRCIDCFCNHHCFVKCNVACMNCLACCMWPQTCAIHYCWKPDIGTVLTLTLLVPRASEFEQRLPRMFERCVENPYLPPDQRFFMLPLRFKYTFSQERRLKDLVMQYEAYAWDAFQKDKPMIDEVESGQKYVHKVNQGKAEATHSEADQDDFSPPGVVAESP